MPRSLALLARHGERVVRCRPIHNIRSDSPRKDLVDRSWATVHNAERPWDPPLTERGVAQGRCALLCRPGLLCV